MGKTISGIIINQGVHKNEELETLLNCKLSLSDNQNSNYICKIYNLPNSTFLEIENDIPGEPIAIKNGIATSFILSGTTDAYSLNICKGTILIKGFKSLGGERFEEYGDFSYEDVGGDYSLILSSINNSLGENIHDVLENYPSTKYYLEFIGHKVEYPVQEKENISKTAKDRTDFNDIEINEPDSLAETTDTFYRLLNEDVNIVLKTLSELNESKINTHTIAYILVLTRFHLDTKVRREAKKVLKRYSSESLWFQIDSSWEDKHRNIQGYHEKKEYFEHKHINAMEYFLFASANRRNFFTVRPVKGMYNTYSSMTTNKDEIHNVFECYGKSIVNIPEKIKTLEYIKVAKFNSTINLNLTESIKLLSKLPNLHNLVLFATKFDQIPESINKLSNLKNLELYENSLDSFPKGMMLPNLNYLGIQHNNIKELDFKSFPKLNILKVGSDYKSGSIILKNVTQPLTIMTGNQVIEEINP